MELEAFNQIKEEKQESEGELSSVGLLSQLNRSQSEQFNKVHGLILKKFTVPGLQNNKPRK